MRQATEKHSSCHFFVCLQFLTIFLLLSFVHRCQLESHRKERKQNYFLNLIICSIIWQLTRHKFLLLYHLSIFMCIIIVLFVCSFLWSLLDKCFLWCLLIFFLGVQYKFVSFTCSRWDFYWLLRIKFKKCISRTWVSENYEKPELRWIERYEIYGDSVRWKEQVFFLFFKDLISP